MMMMMFSYTCVACLNGLCEREKGGRDGGGKGTWIGQGNRETNELEGDNENERNETGVGSSSRRRVQDL